MIQLEQQLKIARKIVNLNQTSLAKKLGVTQATIANWERGVTCIRRGMRPKVEQWLKDIQQEIVKEAKKREANIPWYEQLLVENVRR